MRSDRLRFAVRKFGRGSSQAFGVVGAGLALFGGLLGNALSILGFVSIQENVSFFRLLGLVDFSILPKAMADDFSPIDILFYAIAVYEGFKFSTKPVSP